MIRRNGVVQLVALALALSSPWKAEAFQQATTLLRVPSVPHTGSIITMRMMPSIFRQQKKKKHTGNSSSSLKVTANPADFGNQEKKKKNSTSGPKVWPCGDELDKRLMKIAIPMILAFMVTPLMGAIDLFFVSRMANPLAVAGQAASNQIYNTAFWLTSFLPSGTYNFW